MGWLLISSWAGVFGAVALSQGAAADRTPRAGVYGELKKWHKVTLAFEGPDSSETGSPNPFLDVRLEVTFIHDATGKIYRVPGYYAADGMAGETGAVAGEIWRVHFAPDETGLWRWEASMLQGPNAAVDLYPGETTRWRLRERRGSFEIKESDKTGRDFRARGRLAYVGKSYLQFQESRQFFLKGGADSPENFLAYADFDGTVAPDRHGAKRRPGEAAPTPLHHYAPHEKDWREGDPSWRGGKGKGIIGALNYLASKGMNSVYFLTMNVAGDGDDVWPWTSREERFRFDCGKLDQWEMVFSQMDRLGLLLHVVTQETENDQLLDSGALGLQRRLYYRELVARFGHHLALVWNLGEENTNTRKQRRAFCRYLKKVDPYDHPVVCHTFPNQYDAVYTDLLGFPWFDGPSLQMADPARTHRETIQWIDRSLASARPWFVSLDEIGPASTGVKPDAEDAGHDEVRSLCLWGNLMAGGSGCEWYFGYRYAHNDLNCEDWRSRARMWDLTRYALEFFHRYLPFDAMHHADRLVDAEGAYCLAKPGAVYAVYLPGGGTARLNLQANQGPFSVAWYNPRAGGRLERGSVTEIRGEGKVSLGTPPRDPAKDWVVLVRR